MIYYAIITCKPALSDLHVIRKTSILGYCSDIRKNIIKGYCSNNRKNTIKGYCSDNRKNIIKRYCSDNRNYDLFGYNYVQASVI